ncbi:mRNA decay activator protein ZFP36L1a [Dunckerocampus dactyliophorus]|uniref:mRNA decay activator protein ZFP36L1a n=1 Tax=Dunckerocampus dactyliophorus TaxID=161453 RepID=UPI002406D4F9|nr:mRNA decay activator protein ZFP36L1a [Dunckerocampus dactyliophorus]
MSGRDRTTGGVLQRGHKHTRRIRKARTAARQSTSKQARRFGCCCFFLLPPAPHPEQLFVAAIMSTAVVSPFFDFETMNKNNKLLSYNSNLGAPHPMTVPNVAIPSPAGALLDRKAVGSPSVGGVYQRRHSVSSTKFSQNQFLNSLKATEHSSFISGANKENRLRDRSFSETGERLLNKCLGPASPTGSTGSQVNSSRYKTELCRPFEENGACKYGDKCQFAHGIHELRSLSRHPKYKTELCRTFHTIGFCPYGPRCHFIHNAEERRGPPLKSSPSSSSNSSSGEMERPRLQHSYSFAGFSSSAGLRDSPTSVTPPPMFFPDEVPDWPSSNPFTYSSQELANLFGPSLGTGPTGPDAGNPAPPSPTSTPYYFRPMLESPQMFESPSSPPDSLSDQEGYQSSSGGSLSGSESPTLDTTRRLPIFSRLSISDD